MVGVGAHRACQRDDEDGPKHVHESCEARATSDHVTNGHVPDTAWILRGVQPSEVHYLIRGRYRTRLQELQDMQGGKIMRKLGKSRRIPTCGSRGRRGTRGKQVKY